MSLIQIAFLFFAAIAAFGLLMAGMIAGKVKLPAFFGPAHGLGGLAALAFLFYVNLQSDATPERAWWALGVFAAGFVGGLLLFRVRLFKGMPLLLQAVGHGSAAALGLWLLYPVAF
ncbi:MAG: hypothetical protein ACT4PZ_15455 [Panacagrimonas sp.]